jgi:hypothetical protein
MAISKPQIEVLKKAFELSEKLPVFTYDRFKNFAEIKSFDGSFNALIHKKFFSYVDNGDNSWKLTKKAEKWRDQQLSVKTIVKAHNESKDGLKLTKKGSPYTDLDLFKSVNGTQLELF